MVFSNNCVRIAVHKEEHKEAETFVEWDQCESGASQPIRMEVEELKVKSPIEECARDNSQAI